MIQEPCAHCDGTGQEGWFDSPTGSGPMPMGACSFCRGTGRFTAYDFPAPLPEPEPDHAYYDARAAADQAWFEENAHYL